MEAIKKYFSDIIVLSAVVHRDEVFYPRKNQVTKVHQTPLYQRNDGRYFTKVKDCGNTKQILARDEKALYDKLYEFYYGERNSSLSDLLPMWLKWRDEESSVTKKTIRENTYLWNTFLQDSWITTIPLRQLKAKDFSRYFRSITKEGLETSLIKATTRCCSQFKSA